MSILAFSGSNRQASINHQLLTALARQNADITVQRLPQNLPIYNQDLEDESGIPEITQDLLQTIQQHDALIISVCEHNGSPSAFLKNHLDWLSRLDYDFLKGKKVAVLGASPGGSGGASAVGICADMLPYFGAEVVGSCPVGDYYEGVETVPEAVQGKIDALLAQLRS